MAEGGGPVHREGQQYPAQQVIQQQLHMNWLHFKPEFSGKPDEDVEVHLLRTNNWMTTHDFPEAVKVQRFCLTLVGEARNWYATLEPVAMTWQELQNMFRHQTLKSTRANKILRKAEKDLLQARIKSINFTLDNTSKQLEECRSQLAAIISTQRLRECQDFIDKVGEIRFNNVKQSQLNKFNLLTIRNEGNITRSNTNLNNHNLNSRTNSQVNQFSQASSPPREDNRSPLASPPHGEASASLPPSQANSQAREGGTPPQAGATSPGEDNRSSPAGPPTSSTSLPPSQANSQAREGGAPPQAGTTSPGEDNSLSQAITSPLTGQCSPALIRRQQTSQPSQYPSRSS